MVEPSSIFGAGILLGWLLVPTACVILLRHSLGASARVILLFTWSSTIGLFLVMGLSGSGWWMFPVRTRTFHYRCAENLMVIKGAKEAWAEEHRKKPGDPCRLADLAGFFKEEPRCPEGGVYALRRVGQAPTCSLSGRAHSDPHCEGNLWQEEKLARTKYVLAGYLGLTWLIGFLLWCWWTSAKNRASSG